MIGTSVYRFIAPESAITFKGLLNNKIGTGEAKFQARDGTFLPVYLSISSLQAEGSPDTWCLVVTDLTEQKKNEEIVASERLARSIIEQAAEAIIVCDTSGRIIRFSNAMLKLCGCDPTFQRFEDLINLRFSEGANAGESIRPVSSALKGSAILGVEATFELKDCQKFHLLLNSGPLKNDDGEIIGCVVTLTNITELKQTEKALKESEEQYRAFFENSIDAVLLASPDGNVFAANPAARRIFGMTEEEIIKAGRNGLSDLSDPRLQLALEERAKTGMFKGELNYRRKNGTIFPGEVSTALFKDKNGLLKTAMIIRDITERKEAENALKRAHENLEEKVKERTGELEKAYNSLKVSEKGLAEAQEMAHLGNWEWNIITDELYGSGEAYRIFGINPKERKITYNLFLNYVHPDDREYVDKATKEMLEGKKLDLEYRIISGSGEERIIHTQNEVVFDIKNTPVLMRGTVQDITEQKQAEEALAKIDAIRIKEIHHRIKNNLQVISSLLDLQAETFSHLEICKVPEVLEAFKESQSRVTSMALIHEELYEGNESGNLDFAAYLRKLTTYLLNSYDLKTSGISLKLDFEKVYLDMDTAIPLGIIVNELVTNSLKHAFLNGKQREIRVTLQRIENLTTNRENYELGSKSDNNCKDNIFCYVLIVADNGKGIPKEIDLQNAETLGLQLVNILVDQIDGCIELKRDHGTEFLIMFNVAERRVLPVSQSIF